MDSTEVEDLYGYNESQKEASSNSKSDLIDASERKCKESDLVMEDNAFDNSH